MDRVHYAPGSDADGELKLTTEDTGTLLSQPETTSAQYNSSTVKHASTHKTFVEELNWDINLIDKLHYIATPVIFLSLASIMWITVAAPTSGDSMTFTCWTPAQFTHEMAEYAKNACRYGQGSLYTVGAMSEPDTVKDFGNLTTYRRPEDYITQTTRSNPEQYHLPYLLISLLSILPPLLMCRLLGRVEGSGVLHIQCETVAKRSGTRSLFSPLWLLVCKFGAVTVTAIQYFLAHKVYIQALSAKSRWISSTAVERPPLFCEFTVRLMARVHNYTFQCVIGAENRYQGMTYYIALSVTQIASWWMVVTLLAVLFNALIVLVIFLISFSKKFRSSVIARYLDAGRDVTAEHGTVFAAVLASRNGQTLQVQHLLREALQRLN